MSSERNHHPLHPIRVVARRTGLTPDVIRAWERRYGAVKPERSGTKRRLYSEQDVARLILLRRAIQGGRRVGDVADLTLEELEQLVVEDQTASAAAPRRVGSPPSSTVEGYLEAALRAVRELDATQLEAMLARASREMGVQPLVCDLLTPMMNAIGQEWTEGKVGIRHEHLASAMVRSVLETMRTSPVRSIGGPDLVVSTLAGQHHELGAMAAAVVAAGEGWRVSYLGGNLPAEEVVAAAQNLRARAVAISVVFVPEPNGVLAQVRAVRQGLPDDVAVILGGRATASYALALKRLSVTCVDQLPDFPPLLRELRAIS